MDMNNNLREALSSTRTSLLSANVEDIDSIVQAGAGLQVVLTALGDIDTLRGRLLMQSMRTLQALYENQLPDVKLAVAKVAQAAAEVAELTRPEMASPSAEAVLAELQAMLSGGGNAAKPQAEQTVTVPPEPKVDAAPQTPVAAASLDEITACVMNLGTGDSKELRQSLAQVQSALADPVNAAGADKLSAAVGLLEKVASGTGGDTDLWSAAEQIGFAVNQIEQARKNASRPSANSPATPKAVAARPSEQPVCQPSARNAATPKPKAAPVPTPPAAAPAVVASKPQPTAEAKPAEAPLRQTIPQEADVGLLKEYVVESLEHITNAEAALLALETNSGDTEQINVIFRAFHTIKGTSGFLGLEVIQNLAHRAEHMLDRARNGEIQMTGGYADLALGACDCLKGMIDPLKSLAGGDEAPVPPQAGELMRLLENPEAGGATLKPAVERMRIGDILVGQGAVDRQDVEEVAAGQDARPIGQSLVDQGKVEPAQVVQALRTQQQMSAALSSQAGGLTKGEGIVHVATGRLDSLITMIGELVIAHSMVAHDPDVVAGSRQKLLRNVSHSGKIVRELQDLALSLRMVPLKATFQKMTRLVRDLARKSGKSVQLVTEGDETEIDRNMVEALNDPLVHMIRNAVDHGIEDPDARCQAGKPQTGTVRLRAYHSAGNVVIELTDDGRGIDRQRIVRKAVERKFIAPDADMADGDIVNLIFLPGFSTAEKVTDISGRGVGMDVVRKNVESLRGRVDVASQLGKGSTFTVRLPLTMAVVDAMILRVGNQRYLFPTVSVEQSFRPSAGAVSSIVGKGEVVGLRGKLLRVFRLHELFGIHQAVTKPHEGLLVVVEAGGDRYALLVDELQGQQQVVIKNLGEALKNVPGVAGGAILGDGHVALILDPLSILKLARTRNEDAPTRTVA